jgi:hypothetical protein
MIALMPEKALVARDKDGNCIRTLRSACLANGVPYDDKASHGALYDSTRALELMFKFRDAAPDLFDQMLMNCDFSSSRPSPMLDHILGQDHHVNDQASVFGYVDMRDRKCTPKLGALVTIDTLASKATDAIVMDLAKADVHHLEQLPDAKLLELMNDPEGPFAVIKLNNSPTWFPPNFIYRDPKVRAKAVGNMPKTTLQARANALKQMRSGSAAEVGNNFIQRVQRLYPQSRLCRGAGQHADKPAQAARTSKTFRTPNERIFSLFHVLKNVNQIKNRHYRKAAQLLRDLQPSDEEFKRGFHKESFWKDALHRATKLSEETNRNDPYIEDLRFLVEWQVDDVNPQWLPEADRRRINALKSSMLHGPDNANTNTVAKFLREIEEIEEDPKKFEQMVGEGPAAKKRWNVLKKIYTDFAAKIADQSRFAMNDGKRESLRDYRRTHSAFNGFRRGFGPAP